MADFVVIGGGQAGASLVARLRELDADCAITLICAEPELPYQRPPLSKKYLMGEMTLDRLHLKPREFYDDQRVQLIEGIAATAIDREAREVALVDGRRLSFDGLALTTGSLPRRLPTAIGGDLAGVYPVRTVADIDAMEREFREGARLLVIGGGYIGLEAAAVAATRGLDVTVIEMAPRILQRVAAPETSDLIRDLHLGHGVAIREGVALERLEGEGGRVARAVLAGGETIEVDFAIAGIGISPDTALAEATGLAVDNGIAVDAACRTSDPAIVAAGDCASFPWRGARIRLESVQNAIDQAQAAAETLAGKPAVYDPVPWFWSDQFDARLQIAGLNSGYGHVITRPGSRPGGSSVWYFQNDTLLAVDALNDPKAYMQGKRWIEAGLSPDPARLPDGGVELKALV